MDTKLRSTYNQLGENHEREAKEIQQTVQIGRHPDVPEWRKIDGAGRARTGDHRRLACKMADDLQGVKDPASVFPGNGNLPEQEARIRQLERENAQLRQEKEILKKVLGIYSKDTK